jgi:hypothetical protein
MHKVLTLASALGVPFTLKSMFQAWKQAGFAAIQPSELKKMLLYLAKRKGALQTAVIRTGQGSVSYFQSNSLGCTIEESLARIMQAQEAEREEEAQGLPEVVTPEQAATESAIDRRRKERR